MCTWWAFRLRFTASALSFMWRQWNKPTHMGSVKTSIANAKNHRLVVL